MDQNQNPNQNPNYQNQNYQNQNYQNQNYQNQNYPNQNYQNQNYQNYQNPNYPNYQDPNFMPPQPPTGPVNDGKGMSIAALVCGILGMIGGFIPVVCYFTTILAVLGLIFGIIGRKKSTLVYGKASGIATAGLVLGIIGTAFAVLGLLCTIACTAAVCASM